MVIQQMLAAMVISGLNLSPTAIGMRAIVDNPMAKPPIGLAQGRARQSWRRARAALLPFIATAIRRQATAGGNR